MDGLAKIKKFRSNALFDGYTRMWFRKTTVDVYIDRLDKTVTVPHVLHCTSLKQLESFDVGDEIIYSEGFYDGNDFIHDDMSYKSDFL